MKTVRLRLEKSGLRVHGGPEPYWGRMKTGNDRIVFERTGTHADLSKPGVCTSGIPEASQRIGTISVNFQLRSLSPFLKQRSPGLCLDT